MIHRPSRLLLFAVLLTTQAAVTTSPANASGTSPATHLLGDQLTSQAQRYLQDRADRMTYRGQSAGTARLTAVPTTSALAVQLARETVQLDQWRTQLMQISGGRTRAEVRVHRRSITISGNQAVISLDEKTKLFHPGKNQPTEKFESYRLPHTLTFTQKGKAWLLSKAQVFIEGPRALAPITQFMHASDPVSSGSSLSAEPKQQARVGDATYRASLSTTTKAAGLSAGYRYADMMAYAEKHHHEYNDYFRVFKDNDCTNFISQIVGAGGWQTTPGLSPEDPTKWFYARTTTGPDHTMDMWSHTWSAAENWYQFAVKHSRRVTPLRDVYDLLPSDILQAVWDGNTSHNMDHSMFVNDKRINDAGWLLEVYLTYHSNDTFDKPFQEILAASPKAAWFALRT
jgi:hypothetical protein